MRNWSALVWAGGFALLAAVSLDRWDVRRRMLERTAEAQPEGPSPFPKPLSELKAEAIQAADLEIFHHLVYERVGEERWEAHVKPAFARAVLLRVIEDTGNPLPGPDEIIRWLRAHQDEAKELLERAAESGSGGSRSGRMSWREL